MVLLHYKKVKMHSLGILSVLWLDGHCMREWVLVTIPKASISNAAIPNIMTFVK